MIEQFTKKQVAKGLGLTLRTVQFWTEEGLVTPEIANPTGRGKKRLYSRTNVFEFLLIKELVAFGFSLKKSTEILRRLQQKMGDFDASKKA